MRTRQVSLTGEAVHDRLFGAARRRIEAVAAEYGDENGIDGTTIDQRREIAREVADGLRFLEYAGAGNNRAVFEVDDPAAAREEPVVLKVAFHDRDRERNRRERACWEQLSETDAADLFAPVVGGSGDGEWILQRAVSAGTSKRTAKRLRDRLYDHDLPVMDVNAENTGWLGDEAVVFDYPWQEEWLDR